MPQIYLCFLWHMHQPFYKDLISGQYKLPWTRMHALKDYYGMVKVLEETPGIHQTFNLVPSMMVQLEEYTAGEAADPFLRLALMPAESLTEQEQGFILRYFFQANPARLIARYPRYQELFGAWLAADKNVARARLFFGAAAVRDLQVLSQLAWIDEEFLERDPEIRELAARGRNYSLEDQDLIGRKQIEILRRAAEVYREFAARGQIEISTTPFYHPILPLLCDSNVAQVSHPYVPLPNRFRYPEDARHQMQRAREYMQEKLGRAPAGMWPSEGSVSDEALSIASEVGFEWTATDDGVLSRTLNQASGPEVTYHPYLWRQQDREIRVIFRDHYLSDLIGFVYARMDPGTSAAHFLERVRDNCRGLLAGGRDALVPVILDGENAWEHFERNGRPFLRELYRSIERDGQIEALTVSEALRRMAAKPLTHIFPGSWINTNFDVWIGSEEDNRAWDLLARARQTYERVVNGPGAASLPREAVNLAYEELLIAEGSDWCWWYGPEHDSENRPEFDQLFRDHLANVYRALRLPPPEELSRPILRLVVREFAEPPSGPIRPWIDGEITSYFEWLGAGIYRVDSRSGAMHGHRYLIHTLYYGSDGQNLYLRLDFEERMLSELRGMEARFSIQPAGGTPARNALTLAFQNGGVKVVSSAWAGAEVGAAAIEAAFRRVLEVRVSLAALGVALGQSLRFQLSLWKDGLPMDALPHQGWLEFSTTEPSEWPI